MSEQRALISWTDLDRQEGDARDAMAEVAAFLRASRPDPARDAAYRVLLEQLRITLAQICEHPRVRGDIQAQLVLVECFRQPDLETLNLSLDRLAALLRPARPARPAVRGGDAPVARPVAKPADSASAPAEPPPPAAPQAPRRRLWV